MVSSSWETTIYQACKAKLKQGLHRELLVDLGDPQRQPFQGSKIQNQLLFPQVSGSSEFTEYMLAEKPETIPLTASQLKRWSWGEGTGCSCSILISQCKP